MILKEKIINYVWLIAILGGISGTSYWFPLNIFIHDLYKFINSYNRYKRVQYC